VFVGWFVVPLVCRWFFCLFVCDVGGWCEGYLIPDP
jgi:hypothetical protein